MTTATKTNGRTPRVLAASTVQPDSGGLMDALLAISAEVPKLVRTEPGQIQNRTYLYVTLDALLDVVVPLLIKHELVWVTKPTTTETGQPALKYRLTHVPSGEFDEDVMPLMGATDSQGVGSALTYARRYALLAVLNLAPGEDDDGAAASAPQLDKYPNSPQGQPSVNTGSAQPTAAPPKRSERQLSEAQKRLLRARAKDLNALQLARVLADAQGEAVAFTDEAAAKRYADRELDRLPARLVDAVLEGIASCPPF